LKVEKPTFISFAHDEIRPQRIGSSRRLPSFYMITRSISVGDTFQRGTLVRGTIS
jgi:hypothetical protein